MEDQLGHSEAGSPAPPKKVALWTTGKTTGAPGTGSGNPA